MGLGSHLKAVWATGRDFCFSKFGKISVSILGSSGLDFVAIWDSSGIFWRYILFELPNDPATQQHNNPTTQQQPSFQQTKDNPSTQEPNNPEPQQSNKPTTQQPTNPTMQQHNTPKIHKANSPTTQKLST